MNFNFRNISENPKRIRIIPKNGTELFANIGVDNPTATIDEDGVFSVCLSPNEPPTISCDGASDSFSFYVTRTGQGDNTTFYLEYKTPNGTIIAEENLESLGVTVEDVYGDGFYIRLTNVSTQPVQLIVTLVQIGDKEFVLSHDYTGNPTVIEEGVSYGICLSEYVEEPLFCPGGYYCSVQLSSFVEGYGELQNGDTVYIPIALSPDGESITSPFVIDSDSDFWYAIGENIAEQLNQQIAPYGLSAVWTNNFKEFGVTYYDTTSTLEEVTAFYVLDEGNTYPASQMPRGIPPISCFMPS